MPILKLLIHFLPVIFVFAKFGYAEDGYYTGKLLLDDFAVCELDPKAYQCGRAAVFVKGYAKRLLQGRISRTKPYKLCIPENIGVAQLMEIVVEFLKTNQYRHEELAFWLVQDALVKQFICSNRQKN